MNQDTKESVDRLFRQHICDVAKIESLLSRGIHVDTRDSRGYTLLRLAAETGKVQAVKYLISKGADPALRDNIGRNSLD